MTLLNDLLAIGFTEYEAKVYLALLQENPATGYLLSKLAGIPRSMVYEALGRLDARGAVLKTEENRSTLYRPVPPDVLVDRYEQEHRELLRALRDGLRALYAAPEESRFWSISGRDAVLAYTAEMLRKARREAFLVLDDDDLEALRKSILAASERGVATSALLTGHGELPCGEVARHPARESELQELEHSLIAAVDGQEVLIANKAQVVTATITNSRNLVFVARQFVWMELFAQRIYTRLGPRLLARLDPEDRKMVESFEG